MKKKIAKSFLIGAFSSLILSAFFVVLVLYFFEISLPGISPSAPLDAKAISEKCLNVKENKVQCWDEAVDSAIRANGVDAALDVIAYMYEKDSSSGPLCHSLTHKVGLNAYQLFSEHKDFLVTPKTAYCSYGFYHGFMEILVSQTGDPKEARRFCEYVGQQLEKSAPDARLQCYHGIGHGWANNHENKIEKEKKIIEPALKLCEEVAETSVELSRCATGVFNAVALAYNSEEYDFSIDPKDPLRICREQEEKHQDACYISMNVPLKALFGKDLYSAGRLIEEIDRDEYASHAMINLAATYSMGGDTDDLEYISHCRRLEHRLQIPCIQGYAFGFLENGEPNNEYKKPLELCQAEFFSEEERLGCLDYIFSYLRQWYPVEKSEYICQTVEEKYQGQCFKHITQGY